MDLSFSEYRCVYQAEERVILPEFTGSLWRGALGHALLKHACCGQHPHQTNCVYQRLFEPTTQQVSAIHELLKYSHTLPVPYVIQTLPQPTRPYAAGENFGFSLILIGNAQQNWSSVLNSLLHVGDGGLGRTKGKACLKEICQYAPLTIPQTLFFDGKVLAAPAIAATTLTIPPAPTTIKVQFLTPVTLSNDALFSVDRFLMSLIRRISLLQSYYGNQPLDRNFKQLKQQALSLADQATTNLHSGGWKRYSSRQQLTHPLQGVWGDIILQGEALAEFWAFLYLGQWLQVGKHANMGMGRYRLENANPSTFLQAHIP